MTPIYVFFVELISFFYVMSNTDILTTIKHNNILSVSSTHATCFGRTDHTQAFKKNRVFSKA